MASEKTDRMLCRAPQVYSWGQNGNAEQTYHAQVFQQDPQGYPKS